MNSMRFIQAAIMAEAKRQIGEIEAGREIQQNTIAWNPDTGEISPLRSKEEAHDYRYFPDPDLMPLEIEQELG